MVRTKERAAAARKLCDEVCQKYHKMGGTLGVAAGPDSVSFFSKTKRKEEVF